MKTAQVPVRVPTVYKLKEEWVDQIVKRVFVATSARIDTVDLIFVNSIVFPLSEIKQLPSEAGELPAHYYTAGGKRALDHICFYLPPEQYQQLMTNCQGVLDQLREEMLDCQDREPRKGVSRALEGVQFLANYLIYEDLLNSQQMAKLMCRFVIST